MDQSEIDKLRKEAGKVMSGKDLDETLRGLELLEKSNKELERRGVNVSEFHKANKTVSITERESPGFFKNLKELFILKFGSKEARDELLGKFEAKYHEETRLVESIRSNFKNPEYVKRIKNKFKWRKTLFQLSVILLLISSVFIIMFFKNLNIGEGLSTIIFVLIFGVSYLSLGTVLWRCPACGHKLDFSSKFKGKKLNSSNVKKCPRCYAQL